MKKEYLQQFEELNEEQLSELIDDLTLMWSNKHNNIDEEYIVGEIQDDTEYKVEEDMELERDNNFNGDNI